MTLEYTDTPNGELKVDLQGEMDALGCDRLRPALERLVNAEQDRNVVLDLGQVSFLDSSGIGVMVFLYKRLKSKGRTLEIVNVQGQPRELMELLRIDSAIPVSVSSHVNLLPEIEKCAS
ncbi:MAG: STAS domain-containing protein [Gammaproteobacteria bacterium]|nr:STAS domain-containing protein [Gammaproteobacteria bacterium]